MPKFEGKTWIGDLMQKKIEILRGVLEKSTGNPGKVNLIWGYNFILDKTKSVTLFNQQKDSEAHTRYGSLFLHNLSFYGLSIEVKQSWFISEEKSCQRV